MGRRSWSIRLIEKAFSIQESFSDPEIVFYRARPGMLIIDQKPFWKNCRRAKHWMLGIGTQKHRENITITHFRRGKRAAGKSATIVKFTARFDRAQGGSELIDPKNLFLETC